MLRRSTTKGERLGEAGCYPGYFFQRNEGGAESRGQHGGRCDISFATTICRIVGGLRSRPASITERCSSRTGRTAGARPVYASSPPDFPRSESEVIRIPGYPSAAALLPAGARIDYLESSAHYQTVARRALAALRSGRGSFVLLIGDPPADPRALTEALAKMAGFGCTVIDVPANSARPKPSRGSTPLPRAPQSRSRRWSPTNRDRLVDIRHIHACRLLTLTKPLVIFIALLSKLC
jgi:hypothetical protein